MESIIYALLQVIPSLKAEHVGLLGQLFAIASLSFSLFCIVKSNFTTTVRISERDILAGSLLRHCAKTHHAKHRKSLAAAWKWPEDDDKGDSQGPRFRNFIQEQLETPPEYEPDFGSTWNMEYGVSLQRVARGPEEKADSVVLRYFGRSLKPIENLLKLAEKEDRERRHKDNIVVYPEAEGMIRQYSPSEAWAPGVFCRGRSMDTVCIRQELKDQILDDIRRFTNHGMQERYFSSGIPYRRGYLFYGSRGTGKTSFYKALALLSGLRLYLVNVAELELTDNSLQKLFVGICKRCIVILEEVNPTQLRCNNNVGGVPKKNGISLSGLLSAIDGPMTPEGHLLIMTTNFRPEDFPKELIRPGRVDLAIEFKKATIEEAVQLFRTAYLQCGKGELEEHVYDFSQLAPILKDHEFSHAELQGFFLTAGTPQNALKTFCDWVAQERKKSGDNEVEDREQAGEERSEEEQAGGSGKE
jgi:chaperone BCS1